MTEPPRFRKMERLGKGTLGRHYKARCVETGEIVTLKRWKLEEDDGMPRELLSEVAILKELGWGHKNIRQLKEFYCEGQKASVILEYCDWSLETVMEMKGGFLSVAEIRHFLRHLLQGVVYCHEKSIMIRDLAPTGLLVQKNDDDSLPDGEASEPEANQVPAVLQGHQFGDCRQMTLKIANFGPARVHGLPAKKYQHEASRLWYRSPDSLLKSPNYGPPADLWSVGCIFAEMVCGEPLFSASCEAAQLRTIFMVLGTPTEETWPSMMHYPASKSLLIDQGLLSSSYPQGLREHCQLRTISRTGEQGMDLLSALLRYEPAFRITASEALKHPFLSSQD